MNAKIVIPVKYKISDSHFKNFVLQALAEQEPVLIGELTLPRTDNDTPSIVPVYLDSIADLRQLQEKILALAAGS